VTAPDQQPAPNVNIAVTSIQVPNGEKWVALEFLVGPSRYTFAMPPETARVVAEKLPEEIADAAQNCVFHNAGVVIPNHP
jgi:hypothetical protein